MYSPKQTSIDLGRDIETNPCTLFYLKRAWAEFSQKDPVDALSAAKTLVMALEQKLNRMQ